MAIQAQGTPGTTQPKNFEASFASLSTSYGFGGFAPSKPIKKEKKDKNKTSVVESNEQAANASGGMR